MGAVRRWWEARTRCSGRIEVQHRMAPARGISRVPRRVSAWIHARRTVDLPYPRDIASLSSAGCTRYNDRCRPTRRAYPVATSRPRETVTWSRRVHSGPSGASPKRHAGDFRADHRRADGVGYCFRAQPTCALILTHRAKFCVQGRIVAVMLRRFAGSCPSV